jgi:regulatory protein
MPRSPRPLSPLDSADLERIALRYVERYATTRAKLAAYLTRKIRERGWAGEVGPSPAELAQRMAALGYVDDRLFAEAKAGAMSRRGLGGRRITQALRAAGIEEEDAETVVPVVEANAAASAIAFARRRRIGPFGREAVDRSQQEKQLAAMLRAGHAYDLARKIVRMSPGDDVEWLAVPDWDGN